MVYVSVKDIEALPRMRYGIVLDSVDLAKSWYDFRERIVHAYSISLSFYNRIGLRSLRHQIVEYLLEIEEMGYTMLLIEK